jgi:hypothetical protein
MIENWADDLTHNKTIDYYYEEIKDWYTPRTENKLLPYKKNEDFYLITEPYDYND